MRIKTGLVVPGAENLGFCIDEDKTEEKLESFGVCMTFETMLVSFNRRERHWRKPDRLAETGLGIDRIKKIVVKKINNIKVKKLWSFIFGFCNNGGCF